MKQGLKQILLFAALVLILLLTGCDMHQGERPYEYPLTTWTSEDPQIVFTVSKNGECYGEIIFDGQSYPFQVFFDYGSGVCFESLDDKKPDLVSGDCTFSPDKMVVSIAPDGLFGGQYDKIVFVRSDTEPYPEERPCDAPLSTWTSEDPQIIFNVYEDGQCFGEIICDGEVYLTKVCFPCGANAYFVSREVANSAFLTGDCTFGPDKMMARITTDNLFGGQYDEIVFVRSEPEPVPEDRPCDDPLSIWTSEDPQITFTVTEDGICYGEITCDDEVYSIRARFDYGATAYFVDRKSFFSYHVLLTGDCTFSPDEMVIKLRGDNLFGGEYDEIVFVRSEPEPSESDESSVQE